jgi:hypothetical protein
MALIHFIFELFKITAQSFIYGSLVCGAVIIIDVSWKNILRGVGRKILSGVIAVVVAWGMLFCYMFTYWGDHGLGDFARIPLGHGEEITSIDGGCLFDQCAVKSFMWNSRILVTNCEGGTMVYDLVSKESVTIKEVIFDQASAKFPWIRDGEFRSFAEHYHAYWGGWRFWLLP